MLNKCSVMSIAAVLSLPVLTGLPAFSQEKPALTAEQALEQLKKGNKRFVADQLESKDLGDARRQQLAKGQHPFAIILTCADSRVAPEYVFNQGLGDIFVLRVAGNIADPYELGSIEYAVEHLQVPLVVVLGHTQCGAVEAALGEKKPAGNLGKLIDEVHVGKNLPPVKRLALAEAIQNNVRHQAEALTKRSEVMKEFVEHKKVRVASGVYSLATGKVEWLE
jgi:carbonic anhydrase